MAERKTKDEKRKTKVQNLKLLVLSFSFALFALSFALPCPAQQNDDLEFTLDATSKTIALPKIFKAALDLSGCGLHRDNTWPQSLATGEVLGVWQKEIGFRGLYRMQYNLWEISQLAKEKDTQDKLLENYEELIQKITDAGGTVILDIFGTPAGLAKALDKKIPPENLKVFKEQIKETIRYLSCKKRYNIWYEVWNAPDLESFFLGRKQEYLNLYRVIAEAIKELRLESKIHIPIGGPSVSWWFQDFDGNTVLTPERSLIYDLIKFCYRYHLPLDFIAWHGYSTDPTVEKENTKYKKNAINLIRDWLSYFNFDRNTILIVDEWNYDRDANILPGRGTQSYITASYIPARIKNMYKAGIDYQLYFALEDFENSKEGVVRNVGIFSYKNEPKAIYNVFRMLNRLGSEMFLTKLVEDEFVGAIATKSEDYIALLIYNYIDPQIAINYLSKDIVTLNKAERRILLNIIKSESLEKILLDASEIAKLRGATNRLKSLLKKARELNNKAKKLNLDAAVRSIKIGIKNLKGDYLYERYAVDSSCSLNCPFSTVEQKEISISDTYQETLSLKPYSVSLIIIKNKPKPPAVAIEDTVKKE